MVRDGLGYESWQSNGRVLGLYRMFVLGVVILSTGAYYFDIHLWPLAILILSGAVFWPWFLMWVAKKKLASSAALLSFFAGLFTALLWWGIAVMHGNYIWELLPLYPALLVSGCVFFIQNLYVRRKFFGWRF